MVNHKCIRLVELLQLHHLHCTLYGCNHVISDNEHGVIEMPTEKRTCL